MAGLSLGSVLAFLVGRGLKGHILDNILKPATLQKLSSIFEREGIFIALLCFLLPGAPKDCLCFVLGMSPMSLGFFAPLVTVGRMPATLLFTLQGALVSEGQYVAPLLTLGASLLLGIMVIFRRKRLVVS